MAKKSWREWKQGVCLAAALLLAACGKGGLGEDPGRLLVYTSFYPMYDFTCKIAGDQAEVVNLVPPGAEAHDWEPTAQDVAGLQKADVFVYSGAGMEHWVDSVLTSLHREDLVVVEAAREITLLQEEEEDHGHDHEGADPHVWLSPVNAALQLEQIAQGLVEADPENAQSYRENLAEYKGELEALDREFREALTPLENRTIFVSHKAFGYLCAAYGLEQAAAMDYAPDGEPDPARMAQLVDFAREYGVNTVFYEAEGSDKVAQAVAREIGAQTAALYPLESLSREEQEAGEDYFSVMRRNLAALKAALE